MGRLAPALPVATRAERAVEPPPSVPATHALDCSPRDRRSAGALRGFTLLEIMIVITIVVIIGAVGIPALHLMLVRSKLQSSAQQLAIHLNSSRIAAMRLGRNVVVRPELDAQRVVAFIDEDEDLVQDAAEEELTSLDLPAGSGQRGVYLMGPDGLRGTDADPFQALEDLTLVGGGPSRVALFRPDGSVADTGAFRISDGKSPANIFEVRIDPRATARVEILKFVHGDVGGFDPLADPPGSWFPQGGNAWEWY